MVDAGEQHKGCASAFRLSSPAPSLREQFNRDGYVVVRNREFGHLALSVGEKELKEMLERDVNLYTSYLRNIAKTAHTQRTFLHMNEFCELGFYALSIVDQPVLHVMSPALRIPDGYYGTSAHQDWPSTQGSLDCVTVWIALTDAGVGNFPLEVIPGSHLGGLRDGKMNGSVLEVEAEDKEFIPLECKAGDVFFLSGFLVHRTGGGSGFRAAVSQRFDNAAEPTFVKRGYPCAQKRVVDREIKWKPTVEQVRSVYVD